MAKMTTAQQLANDLARRGGPKRPTPERRQAVQQAIQNKVGPVNTPANTGLQQRLANLPRPVTNNTYERKPEMQYFPIEGRPTPGQRPPAAPTYNAPPMRSSGSMGGMGGQQPYRSYQPIAPQNGSGQQPYRSYQPIAPQNTYQPANGQDAVRNLIAILAQLSQQNGQPANEWTGNGWREDQWEAPNASPPWLPDLWSLSNR